MRVGARGQARRAFGELADGQSARGGEQARVLFLRNLRFWKTERREGLHGPVHVDTGRPNSVQTLQRLVRVRDDVSHCKLEGLVEELARDFDWDAQPRGRKRDQSLNGLHSAEGAPLPGDCAVGFARDRTQAVADRGVPSPRSAL